MEGHFAKIESDISRLDQKIETDISRLDQKIERERSHASIKRLRCRSRNSDLMSISDLLTLKELCASTIGCSGPSSALSSPSFLKSSAIDTTFRAKRGSRAGTPLYSAHGAVARAVYVIAFWL